MAAEYEERECGGVLWVRWWCEECQAGTVWYQPRDVPGRINFQEDIDGHNQRCHPEPAVKSANKI